MTANSKSKFWNSILSIAEWKTKKVAKKTAGSSVDKMATLRKFHSATTVVFSSRARPCFFPFFFVSEKWCGALWAPRRPAISTKPYSLPPARVYQRVPENLNQRIAFSSSIVTRRIGDAEAQRDRYAGGWISNGTWPVLYFYSAFMFSHLSGACERARKSFVHFFPFRHRVRRIVIGSNQTWLEARNRHEEMP